MTWIYREVDRIEKVGKAKRLVRKAKKAAGDEFKKVKTRFKKKRKERLKKRRKK